MGLLVGLLVVTGEEEGGASSDFRLLAGLLANLGGEELKPWKISSSQTSETACCEVDRARCGGCQLEGQTIIFSGQPARQL